jgi:hypothetical protein
VKILDPDVKRYEDMQVYERRYENEGPESYTYDSFPTKPGPSGSGTTNATSP